MRTRCSIWLLATASLLSCQRSRTLPQEVSQSDDPVWQPTDVVVVGGGLAGLVAAYELEKRGLSIRLFEAADRWGGRVATAEYGHGLRAEYGMQEMWEGNPLLAIAREINVGLDEGVEAYSSVVIDGRLYPYVQDSWQEFWGTLFSDAETAALKRWMHEAKGLLKLASSQGLASAPVAHLQEISFKQWLSEEKLPDKVATWIRLTLECEVGADWERFSALFGLLEFHVFFDGGVPNFHVTGGNRRLVEGLAAAVQGPKHLSSLVTRIVRQVGADGKLDVEVTFQHGHHVRTAHAQRVVVAVPFARLHQIEMAPPLSDDHWQAIGTMGFGQYTVVHFLIDSEARRLWNVDGKSPFAVLTQGQLGTIYGVDGEAPAHPGQEVFSLLIHGEEARTFHMVPREAKIRKVLGGLDAIWPGLSQHVHASHVYTYHPAAIPMWPVGRSPLDEGSQLLRTPVMGLYLAGDYTYNAHSDGAARSGLKAAEQVAADVRRP